MGVVVVVLSAFTTLGRNHPVRGNLFALGVAALGVVELGAQKVVERPLDCGDGASLAGSYRARFFLRVAFSDAVALVGFTGFIVTGNPAIYPLGVAFTAIGFSRLAPTARNLAKDQQTLRDAGCRRSLIGALAALPPRS